MLEDWVYDTLVDFVKGKGILQEYLDRNYEDDPVPVALLNEFSLNTVINKVLDESTLYTDKLVDEGSFSIRPVFNYDEVWDFIQGVKGEDLVLSLKVDGIFCKSVIENGKWRASISRGRGGSGTFDYTYGVLHVVPNFFEDKGDYLIRSELYVEEDWLPYLRQKYNKAFVGPKYAGTSLARVHYDDEDYQGFKCICHGMEGYGKYVTDQFEKMKEMGLTVVPYEVIHYNDIPKEKFDFIIWFRDKVDDYYQNYTAIPSDGLVLCVNDLSFNFGVNGAYTTKNIAPKLEGWNNKMLSGIVTSIKIEQRRVFASCRVEIEPMRLNDGTEARVINTFNPSLLIEAGLQKGSRVYYERTSNAINVLSRKGTLLLEGDRNA